MNPPFTSGDRVDPGSPSRSWSGVALALLAGWTVVLSIPALEPRGPLAMAGLAGLRSAADLASLARRLVGWAALEMARFAPLGFLAVLSIPDRPLRWKRVVLVALPAFVAGLGAAILALWLAARGRAALGPGPLDALVPATGIALGVASGLAWRRGRRARLLFLPKLLGLAALLLLGASALGRVALEREARAALPPPVTSADKRRLFDLFRGTNPLRVPPGETRTVRLSARDLDLLAAWGSAALGRARVTIALEEPGTASMLASVPAPHGDSLWLNVASTLRLQVEEGKLDAGLRSLRVGRLAVPPWALGLLSPVLLAAIEADGRVQAVLAPIRTLRLDGAGATATWGRLDLPRKLVSTLVWGEAGLGAVRSRVDFYVSRLLESLAASPGGDARFAAAVRAAFDLARQRSQAGSALEENRAALIALGVVLGHERIASLVDTPLEDARAAGARRLRRETTVRGRADWVRHFTVSAALTVLSWVAPSDAAGLFKEERDAGGGSGFSFGDLLADRAGTMLADVATRDEAAAVAMQQRLGRYVRIDDLFPPAADLPEDIQDAELQGRYGGVGGPLYRHLADEIERRLAACPAYRPP